MNLYSTLFVVPHTQGAQVRITQCYLQITPYLPVPRKHSPDGAFPDWGCGHLIAAYYSLSTPKGWKAESAWLADLQRTVYPHKWSPVSRRLSAWQRKFACQRPTFYHCATQPISLLFDQVGCTLILGILYRIEYVVDWCDCHQYAINRVTTCLENLEMSGNLTAVSEMSGILLNVREVSKTVYCEVPICIHTGI